MALRDQLGKPLIVRSSRPCPEQDLVVGGATRSWHTDRAALDIGGTNHDPETFEAAAYPFAFLDAGYHPPADCIWVDLD